MWLTKFKRLFQILLSEDESVAAVRNSPPQTSPKPNTSELLVGSSAPSATGYDDGMLQRARTQWQFGDWESLSALEPANFENHPERGRLALLAAAGHLQCGRHQQARERLQLAIKWGCSKKLVAQMMVSSVHNTLGRAAAIDQRHEEATRHFEHALRTGSPGSETRLQVQARMSEQLAQLRLQDESTAKASCLPAIAKGHAHEQDIRDVEDRLRTNISKDLGNAVKQIEAFISIQNYLNTGNALSGFHGWPISPDIGLFLIERIRERRHDVVIEFGSGTSTTLFAKAMQINRQRAKQGEQLPAFPSVYAFEHDVAYLRKTKTMLEAQGLVEWVSLNHAPLIDWQDESGCYRYYSCDELLAALATAATVKPMRVLVLVDGPPGATCPNARYPAVPVVFRYLASHEVDVVLDDANRSEEKAIIELWRGFWSRRAIRIKDGTVASEKGLYWARNYDT